jgi:hypothetical protein
MTREEIISGLQMTMDLIQFGPVTGNVRPIYTLNDIEKTTYVACKAAIEALKAQNGTDTNVGSNDLISRQTLQNELALYLIDDVTSEDEAGYNRAINDVQKMVLHLPSAQPETAKRIVGKSRDGMTLWYQCDMCNEPVDVQDNFCRGCGRRLTDE